MNDAPPELVAIDYHAQYVGRTADGRLFFLATPFVPAVGKELGREFLALYLFDEEGALLEALIDDLGARKVLDRENAKRIHSLRLSDLGEVIPGRIEVQPFQLERFGITFGLVLREPEDEEEVWAVEVLPGNYMAFFEPFDSGEYDT